MQYAQIKHIPNVGMDDIYTGNGVSELINLCMQAHSIAGTRFSFLRPTILFDGMSHAFGRHACTLHLRRGGEWYPDIADIESRVTRTKAIVIINPNNPTGAVSGEVLQEIVEVARRHQLIISPTKSRPLVHGRRRHTSIAEPP
ncbi:MAG: aminotransferase class I/II-fold pyridoxal phosphate-dependent enzyme [Slackia sp.]